MLRARFYCGLRAGTAIINKQAYLNVVDAVFPGYTVFEAQGCWAGASEPSIVIEVLGTFDRDSIKAVGQSLRAVGHQQAVLVTVDKVNDSLLIVEE